MQNKKKPKKQRRINNAIVSVDDIKIEPGDGFCNWIPKIRIKLKEREMITLQKRVDISRDIITSSLSQFFMQNMQYFINDKTVRVERMDRDNFLMYHKHIDSIQITKIMEECQGAIINELINWEGISCRVNTRKSEDITIRSYFSKCRSWWDQKKKNILAIYFWNAIINLIERFTKEAAAQFFSDRFVDLQNKYHKYLYLLILQKLFAGNIKMPNTANKYLIAAGICCQFIQQKVAFIKDLNVNNDGNINLLSETQNTTKRIRCNEIRDIIVESIRYNYNLYKLHFEESLSNLHNEFKYYGTKSSSQVCVSLAISPPGRNDNAEQQNSSPERIYNNNNYNLHKLCFQETLSSLHNEFKYYGTKSSSQVSVSLPISPIIYDKQDEPQQNSSPERIHNKFKHSVSLPVPSIIYQYDKQPESQQNSPSDTTNNAEISISSSIEPPIFPYIAQDIGVCPNCNAYIPFGGICDYKSNVQQVRYSPY